MAFFFFLTLGTAKAGLFDWCLRSLVAESPTPLDHLETETLLINLRAGQTNGDWLDELRRRREWKWLNASETAELEAFEHRQLPLSEQIQKRRPNVIPLIRPSLRRIKAPTLDMEL